MKVFKYCFFLVSVMFLLTACQTGGVKLTGNMSSDFKVKISSEANADQKLAVDEFINYVESVSDFRLEQSNEESEKIIDIAVDNSLSPEEIKFSIAENKIGIYSGSFAAMPGAVYLFLEKYIGVRFYAPDHEFIPKNDVILLPSEEFKYNPPVKTRTVHSRLFYQNHDFARKRRVTTEGFPRYVPGAGVHTFHRFIPGDKYFDEHPEYYALRNGRRVTTQLCLTNPEVLDLMIQKVDSTLKANPDRGVISVSQDDNTQYCTCENCSAVDKEEGSPSGTMIRFVNEVANAFPDKVISTLAYQYTRKAPTVTKPLDNVLITLCSIECDRSEPIEENCQDFANDLKEWSALTNNVRIWDYTTQFTNFLAPFPNIETLKPNINLFVDNNATWIFEQHSNNPSELFRLRSYLTANLLWDPTLDTDSVIADFTEGYYGESGKYVRKYINKVHEELGKTNFFLYLYGDPSQAFGSFLKPDLLDLYDKWYDSARQIAPNKTILNRVNLAGLSIDYAILEAYRKGINDIYSMKNKDGAGDNLPLDDRLNRFIETTRNNDITLMNEMRYSVDEYVSFYKKTLNRASKNNIAKGKEVKLLTKPKKYANEDPMVLTDGAFGGASFYSNWLGFEGNHCEAIIDLGSRTTFSEVSSAFLKVVNHIVFFPESVTYYYSVDGKKFTKLKTVNNKVPLVKGTPINDIQYFTAEFLPVKARYVKVSAKSLLKAPEWHHGAGLPAWIFVDEVEVR